MEWNTTLGGRAAGLLVSCFQDFRQAHGDLSAVSPTIMQSERGGEFVRSQSVIGEINLVTASDAKLYSIPLEQ